jgi:pyruvate ferredoxin oxidoreductase beta subunit
MSEIPIKNLKDISERYLSEWVAPGNAGCPACGAVLAVRLAMKALGEKTWGVMTTGCMAVNYTVPGTGTARSPWIHPLFGNSPALGSGLAIALKRRNLQDEINLLIVGGDGATADIGFQVLSAAIQRQHRFIYLCYDNQGYMNTGGQSSGTTELHAVTKNSPIGSVIEPKRLPEIFMSHNLKYLATANVGYPVDFMNKILQAKQIDGPSYIQVTTPCIPAWGIEANQMIKIAKKAVTTGYEILFEYNGEEIYLSKPSENYQDKTRRDPLIEYFQLQKRFSHIIRNDQILSVMQDRVDRYWERLGF